MSTCKLVPVKPVTTALPSLTPIRSGLLQRKCACGNHTIAGGECEECRKKKLQRAIGSSQAEAAERSLAPPIVQEVLASTGQPLDPATRAYMEPRFGYDFSKVRIHTDAKAAESARAVNALAYTVGPHIAFAQGRFNLGSNEGRRLIAHELTHVVQQSPFLSREPAPQVSQSKAGTQSGAAQRVANLADLLESYANRADSRIAANGVSANTVAPVRRNLADLRTGIERLREFGKAGDEKACAAILSGFTPARLREASKALVPAQGQKAIAIAQMQPTGLAAKSLVIDLPYSAAEAEAERVADTVLSDKSVSISPGTQVPTIQRFLDAQAAAQLEANAPVIVATTGAALEAAAITGAAIAAGGGPPGWVIGLAILAVVAVVAAGGYLYYRSQQAEPETKTEPKPEAEPQPQTQTKGATAPAKGRATDATCVSKARKLSTNGCNFIAVDPLAIGGLAAYTEFQSPHASEYCRSFTGGEPCEYWLYPPGGGPGTAQEWGRFDGYDGSSLIECKCGYDSIVDQADGKRGLPFEQKRAKSILDGVIREVLNHLRRAAECGLSYRMVVSSSKLKAWLIANGIPESIIEVSPSELCD